MHDARTLQDLATAFRRYQLGPGLFIYDPLPGVAPACLALRCSERHLMQWSLSGELEWTFDLRRAGARRSCLRILTESIIRLQQRNRGIICSSATPMSVRNLSPLRFSPECGMGAIVWR